MTTDSRSNGEITGSDNPALTGTLSQDYEEPIGGGGSGPKDFVPPSEVRAIFHQGLDLLDQRLNATSRRLHVDATVARVKMRERAIAKSHRHDTLFDRLQVAGVQRPGDILAVVTRQSLRGLGELVDQASQRQLAQLSSVEEVSPYEPLVTKGDDRSVISLFDARLDDGSSLQQRGLDYFRDRGIELGHYGKTKNFFFSELLPDEADLKEMPWVRQVRPSMRVRASTRLGANPIRPLRMANMEDPLPLPIVGVIDSGIDSSNASLRRLLVAQEHPIPPQYADFSHGTLVGALAATGGGFTNDPNYFPAPISRLLDVQVFGSGIYEGIDEVDLLTLVEDAVLRYGPRSNDRPVNVDQPVVVWNLSLGGDVPAADDKFSDLAMELDRIAQENRIVMTIAAGNFQNPPLRAWTAGNGPSDVANGADRISPPADSALSISVGSLSDTSNPPSVAPADCPSPFSRRGPGPGMLVKPDLVHYGGTCGLYCESAGGIRGPARNGIVLEDIGTSFASPRVAAQLAQLVSTLPEPEPELLKLLLLMSCESRGDHQIDRRESVNYYGFGVPQQPAALLSCQPWECIVLLKGELRPSRTLQTAFPFPTGLESNGRRRGLIRIGLVYTPFLDATKGSEYCQTNVTASFGRQFDYPGGDPRRYRREVPPLPQEEGTGPQVEKDLIEHGWKWSPTKLYERAITRMQIHPREIGWRLTVELLLRRELEPEREYVRQPFWLGIKVSDPQRLHDVYAEMRQQIDIMGLAQPIVLRPRITAT